MDNNKPNYSCKKEEKINVIEKGKKFWLFKLTTFALPEI